MLARRSLSGCTLAAIAVVVGCAAPQQRPSSPLQPGTSNPAPARALPVVQPIAHVAPANQVQWEPTRLPAVVSQANYPSAGAGSPPATTGIAPPEPIAVPAARSSVYPISLPTALQLADAENLQVAYAREQIRQAYAKVDRASVLWLPSLRGGLNMNRHEGAIQDVVGTQFDTSRGAFYTGLGAGGFGAGSPVVPGIYMNFALSDAIFQPLAARQFAGSRERLAAAARNDASLRVGLAYLELLRAHEDAVIAASTRQLTDQLATLTADFAKSGQGLQSDADRLQTEATLRQNEVVRCEENIRVASARLAQLLRIDPQLSLQPLEPALLPVELQDAKAPLPELVAQGLSNRPELSANRFLVGEAVQRLKREKCAPLLPSVILGASYGGLSAGVGSNLAPLADRFDLDAIAYWELRNLGAGERAARGDARSVVEQAHLRELETLDLVAREVVEAHAQVEARGRQIDVARNGVVAAEHSYRRNLERIRGAQGLPIEALQSIQALAQARREHLRAVSDYNAAQFSLHRALGCPVALDSSGPQLGMDK